MKLGAKLVAVVLLEIAVLLAIDGYLAVQRESRLFQTDMQRDAHLLGSVLRDFVAETWRNAGQQRALELLGEANREHDTLRIRWVWLNGRGDERYRPLAPVAKIASAAGKQELTVPVTDRAGQRFLCTYVPVVVPSTQDGAIEMAEPLSQRDSFVSGTAARNLVLGLTLVTVGGASLVSLGIVLVGRPLRDLAAKARQIGRGDLSPSLVPRGNDELAELARSMNDMCRQLAESRERARIEQERRIAALEQLRQADRLRTVGQLAAGVAHELGTPLNTISIRAGMLVDIAGCGGKVVENARIIKSQCSRVTAVIRDLLDYARPRPPQQLPTDVRQLTRHTITLLAPLAAKYDATVTVSESDTACMATVDANQIQQVLTNLLVNALQAAPTGKPKIEVNTRHEEAAAAGGRQAAPPTWVCISVRDYGTGISAENLTHIFDPFFTTKDVGEGTGLGLSIAYGIVQEHGGWIDVTSSPGEGSRFAVYLPSNGKNGGTPDETKPEFDSRHTSCVTS